MAISPISSVTAAGFAPISPIEPTATTTGTAGATSAGSGAGSDSFAASIGTALDELTAAHAEADSLALEAATGDLTAVHDYTIASTEAQLMTQLTVEVRNRAIEAFNDIMRMQV